MHPITETFQWRSLSLISQVAETRSLIKHNGIFGENNEELLAATLRDYLDEHWEVGSGEIIDIDGVRSPQCDLLVYNASMLPRAFRSKGGKVVVPAHAVGSVIEVKTSIDASTGDDGTSALTVWTQTQNLAKFASSALAKGNLRLANRSHTELIKAFTEPNARIPVFAFSYSADLSSRTLNSAFDSAAKEGDCEIDIFVLDTLRSAKSIKETYQKLGEAPTKEALLAFSEGLRLPNGNSFSNELFTQTEGGKTASTLHRVDRNFHGPNCLRMLIKTVSSKMHTESPGRLLLPSDLREQLYSSYHAW